MKTPPITLAIAGSDCSGGAGIQADIKAISAQGAYAAAVITAVTVQNTLGVQAVYPLPPEAVARQIAAVMDDLAPQSVKIGMMHDAGTVRAIARTLNRYARRPVVCDPVMVSTSGRRLMEADAIEAACQELFPLCTLITPNLHEASLLLGQEITLIKEMEEAARTLGERYRTSVLVKGGHLEGDVMCDVLYHLPDGKTTHYTTHKIASRNLHGTGCTLSSAIAAQLAHGLSLPAATALAKAYVQQAIEDGKDLHIGQGNGPLWHFPSKN